MEVYFLELITECSFFNIYMTENISLWYMY